MKKGDILSAPLARFKAPQGLYRVQTAQCVWILGTAKGIFRTADHAAAFPSSPRPPASLPVRVPSGF